jgi:hypothetical protein
VPDATHEEMRWFNELEQLSASAETAIRLLHVLGDIDVTVTFFYDITLIGGANYVGRISLGSSTEPVGEGPEDVSP